jgi:hypothetical protein
MNPYLTILSFSFLLLIIFIIAIYRLRVGTLSVRGKLKHAQSALWDLHEFLNLNPSEPKHNGYYRFNEEPVRSHAHRFVGRFDGAILHWEQGPILDMIIENKFPVSYLPDRAKREDVFQAGLYANALAESGVSCNSTKLVIIYCLQDTANRCLQGNSAMMCWQCSKGRLFTEDYNQKKIMKHLSILDEVWHGKRKPRANSTEDNCRPCPFSKNSRCRYSAI